MNEIRRISISNKENKIKINPTKSRNSLNNLNPSNQRKDMYGNVISKKIKNHKISFADEVGTKKELSETIVVSSHRDYHRNMELGNQKLFTY